MVKIENYETEREIIKRVCKLYEDKKVNLKERLKPYDNLNFKFEKIELYKRLNQYYIRSEGERKWKSLKQKKELNSPSFVI